MTREMEIGRGTRKVNKKHVRQTEGGLRVIGGVRGRSDPPGFGDSGHV